MKYKHIKRENSSNKLLIFFNDMGKVGELDDSYMLFNTLILVFFDYDILFIKDIKIGYWYLTIIDEVKELFNNIIKIHSYESIYGLTSSSGSICLLNTLYLYDNFKKAVIINGQPTLKKEIVDIYKNICYDCVVFDRSIIKEIFDEKYMEPFEYIDKENLAKYVFFFSKSISDFQNYLYTKSVYPENISKTHVLLNNTVKSHSGYIILMLTSINFLESIKRMFDNLENKST
jgi:hypothetical protein